METPTLIAFISVPLIGAFIGWITNWVAVKMLFHPRQEVRILGISFHGVFPRRQAILAERLGEVVSEQLVSMPEILAGMNQQKVQQSVLELVSERMDGFLWEKLPKAMPMIGMFLSPELVGKIKQALLGELTSVIPELISSIKDNLSSGSDIKSLVREKVLALPSEKVEELLQGIMKSEFRFIELVGGVLGFIIGVLQLIVARAF